MTKTVTRLSAITLAGVLAAATFSLYTFDAAAFQSNHRGNDGDRTEIEVENEHTTVSNNVSVTANTGRNDANGGDGDDGGNGGDANRGTAGNGGRGGDGGAGGTITTGPADAYGTVLNDVNNNRVTVEGCGCDNQPTNPFLRFFRFDQDGKVIKVEVENKDTTVRNSLDVRANTGNNNVNGGDGDDGGNGGDAGDRYSRNSWFSWFMNNQGNAGNGGAGGSGGTGGTIRTGVATAEGHTTSYVNTNVVRVLRGADAQAN